MGGAMKRRQGKRRTAKRRVWRRKMFIVTYKELSRHFIVLFITGSRDLAQEFINERGESEWAIHPATLTVEEPR